MVAFSIRARASKVDHRGAAVYAPPHRSRPAWPMREARGVIDLGLVDAVDAEAIGEPGQRTFRVRARTGTTYAALWLEKESLASLGRAISQLLAERSSRRAPPMPRPMVMGAFVEHPDVDLQVARLGIDFDPER